VGGDKVLVINNDVELPTYFYSALQSRCGGSRPFVTGISVSARAQVPPVVPINFYHNETDHPDFSAFMLTKEVTDRVGWFDEKYRGAYFEDGDMHVRMHRAGIRAVSYNLPFYHERSSTLKNAGRAEQNRINRAFDINKETFKKKYGCYPGTPEYDQLFA
jgi:GT2 family glycosyltransferase